MPSFVADSAMFLDNDGSSTQSFSIDTERGHECGDDELDDEPFAGTTYISLKIRSNISVGASLDSFKIRVNRPGSGKVFRSKNIAFGAFLEAKAASSEIQFPFAISTIEDKKVFFGSSKELIPNGFHNVSLILKFIDGRGDVHYLTKRLSIHLINADRCTN
ncbi:MAG: hypothetical protein SGJ02_05035 [bacterium]|nr:hypothetical protein [bacterium]